MNDIRKLLTEKNSLEHRLPDGDWENYLYSLVKTMETDLPPIKKTVRLQKIMRYIYDNEVSKLENELKTTKGELRSFRSMIPEG